MKKFLYSILLIIFLFPINVLAEGYISVSPNSLTIEQGSSKTFTINAYNTIGDISIISKNNSVASVSNNEWTTGMVEEKQTKTGSITVTGNSVGTTIITLTIDAATFDGDDLAGQTKTITVNVVAKSTPTPDPTPSTPTNDNNNNNNNATNNLSKNNNLKSLSIEGQELVKVDNNNYTLTVTNDVTSININATAEDSKAKVAGTGVHELQVGENNIEVIITSESGAQNKINIKVTRKDGYYLEDLDSILNNSKLNDVDITINADSKISKEEMSKIKDSKKTIRLNYYDENKKLIYSWTINGNEIKNAKELTTTITYTTENLKEIYKLSNYADGLYINFENKNKIPNGIKVKIYVGDKFNNEDIINIYYYNSSKKLLSSYKNVKVNEGYIEFDAIDYSEYFITKSDLSLLTNKKENPTQINIFLILSVIEIAILLVLMFIYVLKIKPIIKQYKNITKNVLGLNASAEIELQETTTIDNSNINNNASVDIFEQQNNNSIQNKDL